MRRSRKHLAALVPFGFLLLSTDTAAAAPGKCDVVVIDPLCEVGKTVAGKAGEVLTAPVRYAANSAVDAVTSWVADTAQWILKRVINFIEDSTTPSLDADWFTERYEFMIGLAALILVPMLIIATLRAVVTQDLGQLVRSFFVFLPVAILGTFAAVTITQALLSITDAMSAAVARNIAGDVSGIFDSVGSTLSNSVGVANPALPSFAVFFGALLLIVGSFFVWLELLVRSAAVTVAVFFLPMILAGLVWPAAMRWTRRLIEILVALILSKFVVVAVISLATAALAEPGQGRFASVMGGAALMLMAAFSPFALLKLMPMVEGAAIDHLRGTGRGPIQTVRPDGGVNQAISIMRSKTRSRSGGLAAAGAGAGGAVAAGAGVATVAVGGAKAAAASPGKRADRQTDAARAPEPPAARDAKPNPGGGISTSSTRPANKERGKK
jgi:type IV secretion system protein TrbL